MRWLLTNGINVNATDHGGLTYPHTVAIHGLYNIVNLLLDYGADPLTKSPSETQYETSRTRKYERVRVANIIYILIT